MLFVCQNICTKKQKVNKTCSIKYNLIYYRYKNIIQKELIQSVNTIKFSHPSLIFLSCLPFITIIASFVVIGKIDSSHPNHNSILKIFGNRTQEVRIRRYVELSIFVCCVGRTFWLVRNKGDVYPFKVLRICNCMSSKMTKYFKIFQNFNFFNIKKQIRLKQNATTIKNSTLSVYIYFG